MSKEPIELRLISEIINKEFLKDMLYLHVGSFIGPFLEGHISLLNAKGELYTGNYLDVISQEGSGFVSFQRVNSGLLETLEESFMDRRELPTANERSKNGWTYFYLGYHHVLYVNNKIIDSFCKHMNVSVERDLKISEQWVSAGMASIDDLENQKS